ncbi:hypothetical protein HIM_01886 [Hirsutella minnesotensis 3608]|nr:hypothetical protein HIM_01886 [Hirsutella minnesotensis 3608]
MAEPILDNGLRVSDRSRAPLNQRHQSRQSAQLVESIPSRSETNGTPYRKRFPEKLQLSPGLGLRSRTDSTRSSISSAHVPDSATICSVSTLASPLSSSYASDIQERFAAWTIDGPKAAGKVRHRHQPSNATTCSTFINDDNDLSSLDAEYLHLVSKTIDLQDDSPRLVNVKEQPPVRSSLQESFVKEETLSPDGSIEWSRHREGECDSPTSMAHSDTVSVTSEDISVDEADKVLDYTMQLAYGIELAETSASPHLLRPMAYKLIHELGQHIWQAPSQAPTSQATLHFSTSSTSLQWGGGDGSNSHGKRKKQANGEDGGDDFSDGEGSGFGYVKRAKPSPKEEETLRISCPYRKRNPHRFNVRDHHSCAMTYFPKFAELRQHIVKQHKRDDPSAFVCDRCTRDFSTRKELRDHQRQPKERMCDISDHDPESGIDGPTAIKLVSRKRASGMSADVQWREIWNILFPDDDDQMIQPFYYVPVIEHFELSSHYLNSFGFLQESLRSKMSNPTTLETLAAKFHQCFIEAIESCSTVARSMPYTNRSNKRNEPTRAQPMQGTTARKPRAITSRPDSGVVLDDGSEESGSVLGTSGLSHRDSVRTVKENSSRPGSYRSSMGHREVLPAPPAPSMMDGVFTGSLSSLPLSITPGGVDPAAAVRAWSNGVQFDGEGGFGLPPNQWVSAAELTPQTEFAGMDDPLLYQTDFGAMGNGFTGFNEQ